MPDVTQVGEEITLGVGEKKQIYDYFHGKPLPRSNPDVNTNEPTDVLTIEYAKWVFAAIFADSTSTELRRKLSEFLTDFEQRHGKTLPMWLGDLDVFADDIKIIDDAFPMG